MEGSWMKKKIRLGPWMILPDIVGVVGVYPSVGRPHSLSGENHNWTSLTN